MWLTNSSIGRKVIMSVTGIALILFLTFHACMNVVALVSAEGYNWICEMLGANWYAVAATVGLGALVALHFVYAFILTFQNRKARGASSYAVTDRPAKVEWASQNMLALGVIVILGMLVHLYNFWFNMMFAELTNGGVAYVTEAAASDGIAMIKFTFGTGVCGYVYTCIYLVWLCALWFHLTHGFWSAFQTLGLSGKTWFCRLKCIGQAYATIIVLMFVAVAVWFCICGHFCPECC